MHRLLIILLLSAPAGLHAQRDAAPAAPLTPAGWAWRTDTPAEPQRGGTGNVGTTRFEFTPMAPGWHVTTGPGAILYPTGASADGRAAVMRHERGTTRMLMDWTATDGIAGRDTSGWARHRVRVRAEPDSIRVLVNDVKVGAWQRASVPVDGAYGFRIGAAANLHITNLDVTRRLAPYPASRP